MKSRAIRGTLFSFLGFGGGQFMRLAANLILTRILVPEAFGLMALLQVVLVGLQMFSDVGMRASIIQSARGDEEIFLNTAWIVQILRGGLLWLIACLLAQPAANFYGYPELAQMLPIVGLSPLIAGFNSTRLFQANRNLYLGPWVTLNLSTQFLASAFTILLAYWLQSVWALVFGLLFGTTVKAVGSHFVLKGPKNRPAFELKAFREMFHFGKYIFIATIAGYFITQGDRMILGKFVPLETLAIFTIAFFLANVPTLLNERIVAGVLMPLYRNRPPAKNASNRRQIGRARLLLSTGLLSIATLIALIGEPLIEFLYDPRYYDAGPMLVLLSLSIMPKIILDGYKQILLANGNSRDFAILIIGTGVLSVLVLYYFISTYGIIGAIIAPFLIQVLTYPFVVYFIRRYNGWYGWLDLSLFTIALAISAFVLSRSPAALELLLGLAGSPQI